MIKQVKRKDNISVSGFKNCWRLVINKNGSVSSIIEGDSKTQTSSIRDIYEIPAHMIKRVDESTDDSPFSGLKVSKDLTAEDLQAIGVFCETWSPGQSYLKNKLLIHNKRVYRTTEAHMSIQEPGLTDMYEDLMG